MSLTGENVVFTQFSRFEDQCGVVGPELREGKSHTVHGRVSSVLDWINVWIADGKCHARHDDEKWDEEEIL